MRRYGDLGRPALTLRRTVVGASEHLVSRYRYSGLASGYRRSSGLAAVRACPVSRDVAAGDVEPPCVRPAVLRRRAGGLVVA
jgi:hypothetical protein